MKQSICQHCNILFNKRPDSIGKFCSKSCNAKFYNSIRPKKTKTVLQCLNCSIQISRPNKFCGHSCSAIYNNKLRSITSIKNCPTCKVEFYKNTKYCSKRCGYDAKKKFHSPEYIKAKQRETYRRYIAKKKYQTPVGEDLTAIKDFYIKCPPGYEVDHIIPISKGGSHSLANLQYLTKEENRKKSNKIL
jgi:hypothetical protein